MIYSRVESSGPSASGLVRGALDSLGYSIPLRESRTTALFPLYTDLGGLLDMPRRTDFERGKAVTGLVWPK
jgi:hypothetical protein